jgi:hypothetical protein
MDTKVEDEFIIRSLLARKSMHLIKTRCKMPMMLKEGKRCTRGGETTSCGQILSRGDKEKPSLQAEGDF